MPPQKRVCTLRAESGQLALEYYASLAESVVNLKGLTPANHPRVVIRAGWVESTGRQILLIVEGGTALWVCPPSAQQSSCLQPCADATFPCSTDSLNIPIHTCGWSCTRDRRSRRKTSPPTRPARDGATAIHSGARRFN